MSCLFNSLSYFIKEDSNIIRNKICDYLEENKQIIDGIETKLILQYELSDYIRKMRKMRKNTTWGGSIEIQVACNIWKCKIIVYNYRDIKHSRIDFYPISCKYNNIYEIEWSGCHYESKKK